MGNTKRNIWQSYFIIFVIYIIAAGFFPGAGMAELPRPDWVVGPAVVD